MAQDPDPASAVPDAGEPESAWYLWPTRQARRIYDWTLAWATTKYAVPALAVLAFLEASFFPIPPDALLIPMCLAKRERSLVYAAICTAGSVTGAVLGYYIGMTLWHSLGVAEACPGFDGGAMAFSYVPGFTCDKFATVQEFYQGNAWLAIFGAAFSVIPFKIFTVSAGVFEVGLVTLLSASAVGRGMRFFLVAGLVRAFGEHIRSFIEKRFDLVVLVATVLLVAAIVALKALH